MPYHVSFYDESLETQVEGSYTTDGKRIHVGSGELGYKSAPIGHYGTFVDKKGNVELAKRLLSDLTRAAPKAMNGHGH
jgi:hypothetical protein